MVIVSNTNVFMISFIVYSVFRSLTAVLFLNTSNVLRNRTALHMYDSFPAFSIFVFNCFLVILGLPGSVQASSDPA